MRPGGNASPAPWSRLRSIAQQCWFTARKEVRLWCISSILGRTRLAAWQKRSSWTMLLPTMAPDTCIRDEAPHRQRGELCQNQSRGIGFLVESKNNEEDFLLGMQKRKESHKELLMQSSDPKPCDWKSYRDVRGQSNEREGQSSRPTKRGPSLDQESTEKRSRKLLESHSTETALGTYSTVDVTPL